MKWSDVVAAVLILLSPTWARAQSATSVTMKNLTGTWVRGEATGASVPDEGPGWWRAELHDTLYIRDDSTFAITSIMLRWGLGFAHWNYLKGDTISFNKSDSPAVCRGNRLGYCGEPGYKITLDGQLLTLTNLGPTSTWYNGIYTRVDTEVPEPELPWKGMVALGIRDNSHQPDQPATRALTASAAGPLVTEADLLGGWAAEVEHSDSGKSFGPHAWLILWPDGLWWYGGAWMNDTHGGARWRLIGDTLWLANDYLPYFHPMVERRFWELRDKGYSVSVLDTAILQKRPPYPVPDSIYWSPTYRDTLSPLCSSWTCGLWVYQVSKQGQQLHLIRINHLSKMTRRGGVATAAVLTRDSLVRCLNPIGDCEENP